ncbi:MAG: hypothetical protein WB402_01140, partial [Sulfuricaulis sp.]|uniref:hypothetical protein n=1 Tax=Sulfuricaulis sp. TaxID=2003553 RepID=UPI003C40CF1F
FAIRSGFRRTTARGQIDRNTEAIPDSFRSSDAVRGVTAQRQDFSHSLKIALMVVSISSCFLQPKGYLA